MSEHMFAPICTYSESLLPVHPKHSPFSKSKIPGEQIRESDVLAHWCALVCNSEFHSPVLTLRAVIMKSLCQKSLCKDYIDPKGQKHSHLFYDFITFPHRIGPQKFLRPLHT